MEQNLLVHSAMASIEQRLENAWQGYEGGEEMPLRGYADLLGIYTLGFVALMITAKVARGELPERVNPQDILLLGIATHKITRILTKDWVTAPIRAPFTTYEKSLGDGEVAESSRGSGLQRATGDLLTCPWCSGPWVATALAGGIILAPRLTRMVSSIFASVTLSDWLHIAWKQFRG